MIDHSQFYIYNFSAAAPLPGHDCPDSMMTLADLIEIPIFISPSDRRAELVAYISAIELLIDGALELMAEPSSAG